eukprot:m.76338 g.76338  ORF g.76338 m.76338 type:complete len:352 (+) comp14425_c0_seq1:1753-2808(+)
MDSTKRKALRKERHQITEKLRRKRINEALAKLSNLCGLPENEERAAVLEAAIDMIEGLLSGDSSCTSARSPVGAAPASKRSNTMRSTCRAGNLSRSSSLESRDVGVQTESSFEVSASSSASNGTASSSASSLGSPCATATTMDDDDADVTIDSFAIRTSEADEIDTDTSKLDELLGFLSQQAEHHRAMSTSTRLFDPLAQSSASFVHPLAWFRNDQNLSIEGGQGSPTIPLPFGKNEVGHCMFVGVRCVQANAALAKMCGLNDPEELVGSVNLNFRVREDLVFSGIELLEYFFGKRRVMKTVERMRRADGSLVWVAAESIRTNTGIDVLPTSSCYVVPVAPPLEGPSATFA